VHEGDLLNFLDRLQHEGKALVIVRNCKLACPRHRQRSRNERGTQWRLRTGLADRPPPGRQGMRLPVRPARFLASSPFC
jgi:hypothetical protein